MSGHDGGGRGGRALAMVALPFVLGGCLALGAPAPTTLPPPTAAPMTNVAPTPLALPASTLLPGGLGTPGPDAALGPVSRDADTLVVVAPADALSLVPPAANETEALLQDLLYAPLYRLDESLTPRPSLAAALPRVSEDGLTWTIELRRGAMFHDGKDVAPGDVAFSLRLASSPACQLGRELCSTVAGNLAGIETKGQRRVVLTLRQPYSPFLAEALARLPILSEASVKAATADLVTAAGRLGDDDPDALVGRVTEATTAERCFVEDPPDGCRLGDYREDLERLHRRARLPLPPAEAFSDPNGAFDPEAYGGALLERAGALAQVLTTSASDQQAAALALLDVASEPLGGGPYRLVPGTSPGALTLVAHEGHAGGPPAIERIEVVVEREPSAAATLMLSGAGDWLLRPGTEEEAALAAAPGLRSGRRPVPVQRAILFNLREGRRYADVRTRRAFALCLDREALTRRARADRPLATTPSAAGSWAMPELPPQERDTETAGRFLEAAGWVLGEDGVRARDGVRLSSVVAVRASRPDLYSFAAVAAEQLRECGIELLVEQLDTVGDAVLSQLQWPNDFDTLLLARPLGTDPDRDVLSFESGHVTSRENPADANPGGYRSDRADLLIAEGRRLADQSARRLAYTQLQAQLGVDVPFWPVWYDTASSAIADRVRGPDGPLDPTRARYDWDIAGWTLAPAP
jgi:ABC-type transport system substrate-binding protein